MENKDIQKLEDLIKEKYLQNTVAIQKFHDKWKDKTEDSMDYVKDFIEILSQTINLGGLLTAAQIFKIDYTLREVKMLEVIEKYKGLLINIFEINYSETEAYKKFIKDIKKRS